MVSAVVALLVGILLTIAVIVFLANTIPVPTPACAPGTGGGTAGEGAATATPGAAPPPPPAQAPAPSPASAPSPAPSGARQTLKSGETMNDGDSLISPNGQSKFTYQYGIVQITKGGTQLFASPNSPLTNGVVMLKTDGTLGLYSSQYSVSPVWSSGTGGKGTAPYQLSIQDDGNLLLFDATPSVIWSATISAPPAGSAYSPQNMWVGNSGTAIATGTLDQCKSACSADTTCGGFSREIAKTDDASGACYKFTRSLWTTPGAQQMSNTWKSYVKS